MSSFLFCLVFAFLLSWRLSLAAIPFTIMFIVPGLGFGKMLMDVAMKMIESYAVAGGFAEQAISSFLTVYSYVAENETIEKFSHALQKNPMELGIKQGFAIALMMGSMGFQAWVGSLLVRRKGEKGGDIFVARFNVLMGRLKILIALPISLPLRNQRLLLLVL
ncbi:unnamed protein product [Fraxinus pennsylvanica]|uniref:ABC transmembrane type-1 domain-containing protein n=1 Tax=Fraxinus pennsylvanica TaxID=56036 RepID=A0AAD1YUX4_9LAMI|nr:unnamed protein product [Fraxinus pennsylvanica]